MIDGMVSQLQLLLELGEQEHAFIQKGLKTKENASKLSRNMSFYTNLHENL